MSDDNVIICAPIDWDSVPGSVTRECSKCKQKIWLSPSSLGFDGDLVCVPCGMELLHNETDAVIQPPTLEQVAEVVQYMTDDLPKQ